VEPPVRIELATHSGRVIAEKACPSTLLSPARIAFLILQEVELRPGVLREVLLRIRLKELDTLRKRCIECGVLVGSLELTSMAWIGDNSTRTVEKIHVNFRHSSLRHERRGQ